MIVIVSWMGKYSKLKERAKWHVAIYEILSTFPFRLLMCVFILLAFRENEYTNAIFGMSELFLERITFVPHHIDAIFHLSPSGFKWRRNLRIQHKKSNEAINKRRQELVEMERKGTNRRGKYIDFLDILLQARVRYNSFWFFQVKGESQPQFIFPLCCIDLLRAYCI